MQSRPRAMNLGANLTSIIHIHVCIYIYRNTDIHKFNDMQLQVYIYICIYVYVHMWICIIGKVFRSGFRFVHVIEHTRLAQSVVLFVKGLSSCHTTV